MDLEEIKREFAQLTEPPLLDDNDILTWIEELIPMCLEFIQNLDNNPFHRKISQSEVQEIFSQNLPKFPTTRENIVKYFKEKIVPHFPSTNNKHFLGYIPSDPAPEAIIGAMLTGFFNQFTGSFQGSPAGTAIESQVILWISELLGFPNSAFGSFTSGGSGANLIAIFTGLVHQAREFGIDVKNDGLFHSKRLLFYISDQTHNAVVKSLMMLGIGRNNIRVIESDENFILRARDVENQIKKDKKDHKDTCIPLMIIATAGTTNTGSIDELEALSNLADKYNLWFHIDAAYGGFVKITDTVASKQLKGIEMADSIALDAHKWFYTPFEAGIAIVRDHRIMHHAFELSAEYLIDSELDKEFNLTRNFRSYGLKLTRELRGLKLWFLIMSFGIDNISNAIKRDLMKADYLRGLIRQSESFKLVGESVLGVVCFVYKGSNENNEEIISYIQNESPFYISRTKLRGRNVLRAVFLNLRSSLDLIDRFMEACEMAVEHIEAS